MWNRADTPLKSKNINRLTILLLLPVLFFACAPAVKRQVLVPGKLHDAALLKRVAVLPFSGPRGEETTAAIREILSEIQVQGAQWIEPADPEAVDAAFAARGLTTETELDEASAVAIAKEVGADGVLWGNVDHARVLERYHSILRSRCTSRGKDGACNNWSNYPIHCVAKDARYGVTVRIRPVAGSARAMLQTLEGSASDEGCDDSRPVLFDSPLMAAAREQALSVLPELLAPHVKTLKIPLVAVSGSGEAADLVKEGTDLARKGRMEEACALWKRADALDKAGYAAPYMLGVCAEADGRLREALAHYTAADSRAGEPVEEIRAALQRVRAALEDEIYLKEQMDSRGLSIP